MTKMHSDNDIFAETMTKILKSADCAIEYCSRTFFQGDRIMRIPRIFEILSLFKSSLKSKSRTCKTSPTEDWIRLNDEYDFFLWTRNVNPSSFEAVNSNRKCVVQKGLSYETVRPSHMAWLFSQTPPASLAKTIRENPDLSQRIAIFDFSQTLEGKNLCTRLNDTDSIVFHEFEAFLESEMKLKLEQLALTTEPST
jgi:hypothetical protein